MVGASYSVEEENKVSFSEKDQNSYSAFNEVSYDNSVAAEIFNPSKLYEILIRFLIAAIIVFSTIFFLKEFISKISFFAYSLEKSTILFLGIYFTMFIGGILFFRKKKKIKLQLRNGFLIINSFPSLNQKIPVEKILSCKVNVLNSDSFGNASPLQIPLSEDGAYSFDLNSGVVVTLVNGKSLFIGSSNSQKNNN